jgi:CRP-like cAMP-binding protein
MTKQLLLATLKGIQFLRGVSHEHLEQIAAISQLCDYESQEIVFHQGDVADCMYLVVFGRLAIEVDGPGADHKKIVTVGPGEMIGWSSLLERPQLAATARVLETTRLVRIDSAKLLAICDEDVEFGFQFMRRAALALAKRLNATWGHLSHLRIPHFLPVTAAASESDE